MTAAPAFPWMGQKGRLAPWIVAHALGYPHDRYVEPFAGSAAVLLAKPRVGTEVLNDLDGRIVAFFTQLREDWAALAEAVAATPHSRADYEQAKDRAGDAELPRLELARRFFVEVTEAVNKRSGAGWSYRAGPELVRYRARFETVARRLDRVMIENRDALETITAWDSPTTCFYVDPPYVGTSSYQAGGAAGTRSDAHSALAATLTRCRGHVLLSGYDSPLYEGLYAGWHQARLATRKVTANVRAQKVEKRAVDEVLWSNRPIAVQHALFDAGGGPGAGGGPDPDDPDWEVEAERAAAPEPEWLPAPCTSPRQERLPF